VFEACGSEKGAMHDDILDGLKGFATLAGNLVLSVLGKESLHVFAYEGMSCNESIESGIG